VALIEVLDKIKEKGVNSYKIRQVLEEYERFSTYTDDFVSKYDIATLISYYNFPQNDALHDNVLALLDYYMETVKRMPMDDKKKLIDFIVDYLDHH